MAKRFVRSQNGKFKGMTTEAQKAYEGSIIFNEDEKIISAWGVDYVGVSEDSLTDKLSFDVYSSDTNGDNNAVVAIQTKKDDNTGNEIIDSFNIIGSNIDGKKIVVTANSANDSITLEHETITTELIDTTKSTTTTLEDGGTFDLYMPIEYNNGHVTKLEKKRYKIDYPNANITSDLILTDSASSTSSNTTESTNTTTYLNHIEGNSVSNSIQVKGSDEVSVSAINDVLTIKHLTPAGGAAVTATSAPTFTTDNNTFTAITGLSKNSNGHITAVEAKTFTLPENAFKDTDTKVTSVDNHYTPSANADSELTATTSGDTTISDGGSVITGFKLQRDAKGHVVGATATTGKIDYPTVNDGILTIQANGVSKGTFSANQSTNETINITALDLGLSQAMKYIGKTTTALSDGATTNPITIDSKDVTVESGNVVIDSNDAREYIWNGSKWEEFGNEGNYKVIQTAVSDPTASGTTLDFIATISQDTNGVITPTKSTVPTAGTSLGVVKTTSTVTSTDGLTASPIINGVVYYKDTNTTYDARNGVRLDSGYFEADLVTETKSTKESTTAFNGTYANAVTMDKNGKLMVDSSADWAWETLA